jgi:hypothetical protein
MFRKRVSQFVVAALGVALAGGFAVAQAPPLGSGISSPSDVGGNAGRELSSIYRQGVGTGYTAQSLNQIALRNAQARVPSVGQMSTRGGPSSFDLGSGAISKPFSSYSPSPTVSPYLNLFREDLQGESDLNYQTLVRPMLQQQQFNEQMQRQGIEIAGRLQSIAAQADFNPQGSQSMYPTGHKTVFNYLGHFYPASARRRR